MEVPRGRDLLFTLNWAAEMGPRCCWFGSHGAYLESNAASNAGPTPEPNSEAHKTATERGPSGLVPFLTPILEAPPLIP